MASHVRTSHTQRFLLPLGPTAEEQTARLRADLRIGLPIVINVADREFSYLVTAVETLTPERLKALRVLGGQPWEIAITARRVESQSATQPLGGSARRLRVPVDADLAWIKSAADPSVDLQKQQACSWEPGSAQEGSGVHDAVVTLCKQSKLLPAAVVITLLHRKDLAQQFALHAVELGKLQESLSTSRPFFLVASAPLPLEVSKTGQVHVFRSFDGSEEHYAVEIGKPLPTGPVLTRLHSACFTGDVAGSLKCDCGPQLSAALQQIGEEGSGVVLYLNQEGRGIGLANKMRSYFLQTQGFDTVESNHRLGFEDDERDFQVGAAILQLMGFTSVRLMTNNPRKISTMNAAGVKVIERVPIMVGENPLNTEYLATKAKKSGHLL